MSPSCNRATQVMISILQCLLKAQPACMSVKIVERSYILKFQVQNRGFESHIGKYGLLMWGLYGLRFSNLTN